MLPGSYNGAAVHANEQLFFLGFNKCHSVESSKIIYFVAKLHTISGNAMFFTLAAEYARTVISFDDPHFSLRVIMEGNGLTWANIGAGFATHTMVIVNNGFTPEIFKRNMWLPGEPRSIGRREQGNQSFPDLSDFGVSHFIASL
jgi:hypothetical protein